MSSQSNEGCVFSIPPPLIISPTKSEPVDQVPTESAELDLLSMTEGSTSPIGPLSSYDGEGGVSPPLPLDDATDALPRSILESGRQTSTRNNKKDPKKDNVADVPKTKAKKRSISSKRARESEVEDTAAADSRAAFRHSQRLLRKSAPSLDLKAALHRSFSQQHATPPSAPSATLFSSFPLAPHGESQSALPPSPVAVGSDVATTAKHPTGGGVPSSSMHDVTQRFLSKVHEQKQQTIRTLVTRRETSSMFSFSTGHTAGSSSSRRQHSADDVEEDVELIVDSGNSSRQSNSLMLAAPAKSGRSGIPPALSSPLFAAVEDSRSSASLSPTFSQPDERSSPPQELAEDHDDIVNVTQEVHLISALQRKHELLKFKKQQQQQQQQSLHQTPPTPVSTLGPRAASGNLSAS
ncbi:Hypothetical protein, putative, partial [Bodo saltans]